LIDRLAAALFVEIPCEGGASVSSTSRPNTKHEARRQAYAQIRAARAARFPFPIEGRIPYFVGAEVAARRLRNFPIYQRAQSIKVNPDAPQLPVRAMALADGKRR